MAEHTKTPTQTLTRKPLHFEYCECGCKCYTARGLRDYYSIFWGSNFLLRVNREDPKEYGHYELAKVAAEENEDKSFANYCAGK